MKTKNMLIIAIAMIMAFITTDIKAENNLSPQTTVMAQLHPRLGMIARWKAKKIQRKLVKREMKRRWLRPRHRGITIVI
jgi:hypothetical protein